MLISISACTYNESCTGHVTHVGGFEKEQKKNPASAAEASSLCTLHHADYSQAFVAQRHGH